MKELPLPPSRACSVCRNRMSETCVGQCAVRKDYSFFEPDMTFPFYLIPSLALEEYRELNGRAKGEWMFFLTTKLLEVLYATGDIDHSSSRRLPANFQKQSVLLGIQTADSPHQDR